MGQRSESVTVELKLLDKANIWVEIFSEVTDVILTGYLF